VLELFWTSAKENKSRAKLLDALEKGKIPLHKPCCDENEINVNCGCKKLPQEQPMS